MPRDRSATESAAPLHWKTFPIPADDPDWALYGLHPTSQKIIGWELKIDHAAGGYMQVGDYARKPNNGLGYEGDYLRFSSSTVDTRFRRHAILPPIVSQTTFATGTTPVNAFVYSANIFNTLVMAQGGVANFSLFSENSTSDPTPVAKTYTPGSTITGLNSIVQGSATAAPRLLVSRSGAAPQILSDLAATPTVDSTMHANLAPCYGMQKSSVNATTPGTGTNVFYANNGIWTLPITSADGAAPTQVLSNLPNGGFAIGVDKLENGPYETRMFWFLPDTSVTVPLISVTSLGASGYILHTNVEGGDPVYLFPAQFGLTKIIFACLWGRKLVVTDGVSVVLFDGQDYADTHFMQGRAANTDVKWRISSLAVSDRDLLAWAFQTDGTSNNNTTSQVITLEQYMPQFDSWCPVTGPWTIGSATAIGSSLQPYTNAVQANVAARPSLPYSQTTSFMHGVMTATINTTMFFDRVFLAPSGQNPFLRYRQTGATQNNAQVFASPGTLTSPYFELPDMEGRWKRADEVVFLGDADAAGAGGSVGIALNGGTPIPFGPGLTSGAQVAQTSQTGDDSLWMQLQIAWTLTQGTSGSTAKTPNAFPTAVRGRTYLFDPTTYDVSPSGGSL